MAKVIMVQGTMSNVGKSVITAGLCRIFHQDGYRVAPFKSQNMALNSYVTEDGREMGRAQVMQAEAAGIVPTVEMNPILLKPTNDTGSQVIVNGIPIGNLSARDYFKHKRELIPEIMRAYESLACQYDIIVIEGAGSPAEINLKADDIVNMGLAKLVNAPVLLVGDIDRGGVFAQLFGTVELLEEEEKERIKGLIINKFRGDKTILDPGIDMIEAKCNIPVVGVTPYLKLDLEDEDSLSERFHAKKAPAIVDMAVIRLPRISNFTDFNMFETIEGISLRYVSSVKELGNPDVILLPGTKNTIEDLVWLRESGLETMVHKHVASGKLLFGICGGYQMLGESVTDAFGVETSRIQEGAYTTGQVRGLQLLEGSTVFHEDKVQKQVKGCLGQLSGLLHTLTGMEYQGYEIHMGRTDVTKEEAVIVQGRRYPNVYGTYVHGIFDATGLAYELANQVAKSKGLSLNEHTAISYQEYKQTQYDSLAQSLRESLDINKIYEILNQIHSK